MEDYQIAFFQRYIDTDILLCQLCKPERRIGAMHFGGLTIECLIKAIICNNLSGGMMQNLKTHSYIELLRHHNKLKSRIDNFQEARKWLYLVENPMGQHFIDIRYSGVDPSEENYKHWLHAYKSIKAWLQKQATQL